MRHLLTAPVPTREEEAALLARMAAGDEAARGELAMGMGRLIATIAARYKDHDLPHEDLFMAGMQGCLEALDKWDHDATCRVATYAGHWIEMRIRRTLSWEVREIRIPERALTEERRMKRGEEVPERWRRRLEHAARVAKSLDEPIQADESLTLGDTIAVQMSDGLAGHDVAVLLEQDCLDERDRHVLRRRVLDGAAWREIAAEIGATLPATKRLVDDALLALQERQACEEAGLPTRPKPSPRPPGRSARRRRTKAPRQPDSESA